MYVLVVEDDARVARLVQRALSEAGERVDVTESAVDARARAETGAYDAIVLDIMLPDGDGVEVCRALRREGVRTPILMLTARDAVPDRVRGLGVGADDYLVKPFAVEELTARLRAITRRNAAAAEETLRIGDLVLDLPGRTARRGDRPVELTTKEFDLLTYLMRNPGRVLTKDQILTHVWGYDADVNSNVVETYVHYLRDKIDRDVARPLIRTVRGVGYTIKE
jgi:DNA-binding response OmpR family regulator